mgnify:FL=1
MDAKEYNKKKQEDGLFTDDHIVELVRQYQEKAGLDIDGKFGPITRSSLEDHMFEGADLGLAALEVAIEEIGLGEEGGNNSGPHVAKYKLQEDDGPDDDGAWCAAFISWCIEEACRRLGVEMPFKRSQGAKRLFKNAGNAGSFTSTPRPGDLICWDRGTPGSWQGHIGIVEKIDGSIVHTVEGNVGRYPSVVRRFMHDLDRQSRLEGFARLPGV